MTLIYDKFSFLQFIRNNVLIPMAIIAASGREFLNNSFVSLFSYYKAVKDSDLRKKEM